MKSHCLTIAIRLVAGLVGIDQIIGAPQNDNFVDRLPVFSSTLYATNCGATKESGEPNHAGVPGGSSLWWSWTANHSGGVRILSGPGVIIAVYTGNQVDQLTEVGSGRGSLLFYAREGTAYAIALDTPAGLCGNVTWSSGIEFAPSNDKFVDRLPLTGMKATLMIANEVAGSEPGEPYHAGTAPYRSLWWSWTAPESGRFAVSGEGYAFPARVAVYSGDQLATLTPIVSRASSAPQRPAQTTFNATAGTTYAIALDSIGEGATLLKLVLSAAADNDDFANATQLGNGTTGSTFGATREPGEPATGLASVWYRWTAPTTGGYAVNLRMQPTFSFPPSPPITPDRHEGPTYAGIRYPILSVYRGDALTNLIRLTTAFSAQGTATRLTLSATAGVTYFLAVSEELGFMSDFTLSAQPGPPNDDFAEAQDIVPGQSLRFTNLGTTRELGEPDYPACSGGASLWWKWTAPTNGTFAFDASFEEGQPVAVVYTGSSLTNLMPLGFIAPNNSFHPIAIRALAGVTYWFEVDECNGRFGVGTVTLVAAPPNDDFEHRQTLRTSQMASGSSYGATHEPGEPDHGNGTNSASVWWTWTAPSNGLYGVDQARAAHIYTGQTVASLNAVTNSRVALRQTMPRLEFEAISNINYQIVVDRAPGGQLGFGLSVFPVPPNDHFANRFALEGASNIVRASAANASREFEEPGFSLPGSLWWSWTAPGSGAASILLANATRVDVFTNRSPTLPSGLTNLTGLYGPANPTGGFDFVALSNATYFVAARSTAITNPIVEFTLSFRATPPLIGDWNPAGIQFTTSPLNPWFRQTNTFFEASDAAESGHTGGKLDSRLYASILGPGELSFWWRVATPGTNQNLYFGSGSWQSDILAGPRDWTQYRTWIGPGTNPVSWSFYSGAQGGTAWVDRVEFVPAQPGAAVLALRQPNSWNGTSLRINGELARRYLVETSTNLVDWTVWTDVVRTGLSWFPELPVATNEPVLFFRATTR